MVRNAASTPNLRDAMDERRPVMQLCGNDEYTKALMNRVASGQVSEAEKRMLHERVQVQSADTRAPAALPATSLANYQVGLMRLEEAERQQRAAAEQSIPAHPSPSSEARAMAQTQAQRAFEQQLDLLELQNQKRLLLAHRSKAWEPIPSDTPAATATPAATRRRQWEGAQQQTDSSFASDQDSTIAVAHHNNEPVAPVDEEVPKHKLKKKEMKARKQARKAAQQGVWQFLDEKQQSAGDTEDEIVRDAKLAWDQFCVPTFPPSQVEDTPDTKGKKNKNIPQRKKAKEAAKAPEPENPMRSARATRETASVYCKPFCDFLTNNPTVFHAVDAQKKELLDLDWTELDEREKWNIVPGGKYFVERNGSSMIAFVVGEKYEPGNGCAIIAGHVDALTAKLKPVSQVPSKAGYLQLGVAPYAGGLNSTWFDRDLGIGGRVLVKEGEKVVTKLVKLDWPIARIPTLAPHFGAAANGPFNQETQMVPVIGLEGTDATAGMFQTADPFSQPPILGSEKGPVGSFIQTQPPGLVKVIGDAIGLSTSSYGNIVGWELELFDVQPATVGGLNKEFIFGGRLDDKLCSWAAMQALISGHFWDDSKYSSIIKVVGWFDNEEIGSQLRQGAKSNFMPLTIERAVACLAKKGKPGANLIGRTYANSFLLSSDVTHAVNPNFLGSYLENHAPHLNVGVAIAADPNGHMTTDAVSTAILQRCAEDVGAKLQVFQIRNDSRSGGTIGPI